MATIRDVLSAGFLEPFPRPYWEDRPFVRPLYIAMDFDDWMDNTFELHDQNLSVGKRTLYEHLEQFLSDFCCSPEIHASELKRMIPTANGIWKMHPPKLRVYGWCPAKHTFVAVTGALESHTKLGPGLNNAKRKIVRDFIKRHKLQGTVLQGDFREIFPPNS